MAENKPSWIDYVNLALTIAVGGIGIYVAMQIGQSADRLSGNSLVVATATFLLDDSPTRRSGGVKMVSWLHDNHIEIPSWETQIFAQVAGGADIDAPSNGSPGSSPTSVTPLSNAPAGSASSPNIAPGTNPTDEQSAANQLFAVLGGKAPRLFIEITDSEQSQGAETLRTAISRMSSNGQPVIVPRVEHVRIGPNQLQLRFLKSSDRDEARVLAENIQKLLGTPITVEDKSKNFNDRPDVKPRTYELWFPHGEVIKVASE